MVASKRGCRTTAVIRLPEVGGGGPSRKKIDTYPTGLFLTDLVQRRTAEGNLVLFVAIDRTWRFAVVELLEE
jgi:hypothetical protein